MTTAFEARTVQAACARLGNSDRALAWLSSNGIDARFARAAGIGLRRDDGERMVLIHPLRPRFGGRTLVDLVVEPDGSLRGSGGRPGSHWSATPEPDDTVVVVPDIVTFWLLEAALGGTVPTGVVLIAASHGGGLPVEWSDAGFWSGFADVAVMSDWPSAGGELLDLVRTFRGEGVGVLAPPAGSTWRERLRAGNLAPESFREMLDGCPDLAAFLPRACSADLRRPHLPADLHGLDHAGRLMRLLRIERSALVEDRLGSRVEQRRCGDVVVRSDGVMLDVVRFPAPPGTPPGDRLVGLSDGTALSRLPPSSARCRWSLGGVEAYLAAPAGGGDGASGSALAGRVSDALSGAVGMPSDAIAAAAAFVMGSYVCRAFETMPVMIFHGGDAAMRIRLVRSLAQLAHVGVVAARARGRALAALSDASGGAIVLDAPGALSGPGGPTEIGRFLVASASRGLSADHVSDRVGGFRALDTFGPRAVVAARLGPLRLEFPAHSVSLGDGGGSATPTMGDGAAQALVDDLYAWSMRSVGRAAAADASVGILEWLSSETGLVLAGAGGGAASSGPDAGSAMRDGLDGDALLAAAVDACVAGGSAEITIAQVLLEAALRGGGGAEFTPERVGRWLAASGLLEPGALVTRRRLHGHIARIYRLAVPDGGEAGASADPFAFCSESACPGCRYVGVCDKAVPGLKEQKMRRG